MHKRTLKVVYIRSSKYDDEGYTLRFWRGVLPSNTLLCLKSLTRAVADSGALGDDVEVTVECYDDTVEPIPVGRIARANRRRDTQVVVGLVGVQSNQFARASDLALDFRARAVPVMIGGFHVSGILAMFDEPSRELQRLIDAGVTLVKGEVEGDGVLEGILRDALNGGLKPIYDVQEFPALTNAPVPRAERGDLRRFFMKDMATMDTSRGCPFNCSFCTIVNVQGRKMRHRSAACVLRSIEENYAEGISAFFFTDDNLSRNPIWEELFDGLIALRDRGMPVSFMMQIDTQAYRIPNFVEKARRAGCYRVFVGMESVNPANLSAAAKSHNHSDDYAAMASTWREAEIPVYVGYIVGFPYDTPESVQRDVETLCSHVKVDQAAFFMLTPLPGSRDHKRMVEEGVPLDADLNNLDSIHETFRHPNFAPGEWRRSYLEAWKTFYSKENIVNVLLRMPRKHYWQMFWTFIYFRYCVLTQAHPMLTGLFPLKGWTRRPGYPRESVLRLASRRLRDFVRGVFVYGKLFVEGQEIWMLTRKPADPRWKALAELRERWAEARTCLAECDVRGRCDAARDEIKGVLVSASTQLRRLSEVPRVGTAHLRRKLGLKAAEIERYLREFELQTPSWRQVMKAERYVSEGILARYENMAIRHVARRRRFNAYRHELAQRIRSGRIWNVDLVRMASVVLFELVVGVRFAFTALTRGGL
ncbi:MAG TPA: radical SAM protein [Candidatus Hydrogenedentes bacterium]|nr:radical SAM protein [Candidatus Hydrogenedentota bacterium]HPG65477.1 radical SAM protein [Candidatus Hydrogenedentota bacterium]